MTETMTNAQAALIAASKTIQHTGTSTYPGSRTGSMTVGYSQTPSPEKVLDIASKYLDWLTTAERGTIEQRVAPIGVGRITTTEDS